MVKKVMCFGKSDTSVLLGMVNDLNEAGGDATLSVFKDYVIIDYGKDKSDLIYFDEIEETESHRDFEKAKDRLTRILAKKQGFKVND